MNDDILISVGVQDSDEKMSMTIPREEYYEIKSEKLGRVIRTMITNLLMRKIEAKDD